MPVICQPILSGRRYIVYGFDPAQPAGKYAEYEIGTRSYI